MNEGILYYAIVQQILYRPSLDHSNSSDYDIQSLCLFFTKITTKKMAKMY